jgi:hypothetical protein
MEDRDMHVIRKNGKFICDIDSVALPDGRRAVSLTREALEDVLVKMKIPKVVRGMGRQGMIETYAEHLQKEQSEAQAETPSLRVVRPNG